MATARHTNRHARGTGRITRNAGPDQRRRSRVTLGVGLTIFGLIALIISGAAGGPASPEHGDLAMIMIGLGGLSGLGGFAIIVWGLISA